MAAVTQSLKAGAEVRLVGFGSFVTVKRAAGEAVMRPASNTARFRVGDGLKSALN